MNDWVWILCWQRSWRRQRWLWRRWAPPFRCRSTSFRSLLLSVWRCGREVTKCRSEFPSCLYSLLFLFFNLFHFILFLLLFFLPFYPALPLFSFFLSILLLVPSSHRWVSCLYFFPFILLPFLYPPKKKERKEILHADCFLISFVCSSLLPFTLLFFSSLRSLLHYWNKLICSTKFSWRYLAVFI